MGDAIYRPIRIAIILVLLSAFLISGCSRPSSNASAKDLILNITSPENKTELSSNLANIKGTVSVSAAAVTVQGHPAFVDEHGNFTGYALLSEGANTVEVEAATGNQIRSQILTLDFTPPLAVNLDIPNIGQHFPLPPTTATGHVSNPSAGVRVNGIPAIVLPDGTFSAVVQLTTNVTYVTAVATLGEETDTMSWYFGLLMGTLVPGPSQNMASITPEYKRLIYLEEGSTFTQEMPVDIPGFIEGPSILTYQLIPIIDENNHNITTTWPAGLDLSITPSSFKAYPNASYNSLMIIKAAADLPSGEYEFEIDTAIENGPFSGDAIKIIVLPKGGSIEKTIEVNQSQTMGGITFTLQRVELSPTGMKIYAFNTSPDYALPKGPELAPPRLMALHARANYSIE